MRYMRVLLLCLVCCIACSLAVAYFYDFSSTNLWPFKSFSERYAVTVRTAMIATLFAFWAIWIGTSGKRRPLVAMVQTFFAVLISIAIYGFMGCGGVLGGDVNLLGWSGSTDFIFPSTFFSEYNFSIFMFEVAPVTAMAVSIALYFSLSSVKTNVKTSLKD